AVRPGGAAQGAGRSRRRRGQRRRGRRRRSKVVEGMTGEHVQDLLLDLAYGELPPERIAEVEAHLASCDACRRERDGLQRTAGAASVAFIVATSLRHERAVDRSAEVTPLAVRAPTANDPTPVPMSLPPSPPQRGPFGSGGDVGKNAAASSPSAPLAQEPANAAP